MEAMRSPHHGGLFPLAAPTRRTLPRICVRDPFGDHSANFLRSGPLEAAKDALRASPENAKHMQLIETRRPEGGPTLSSRSRTQKVGKREFREVPSANYWSEPASSPLDHHGRKAPSLGRACGGRQASSRGTARRAPGWEPVRAPANGGSAAQQALARSRRAPTRQQPVHGHALRPPAAPRA